MPATSWLSTGKTSCKTAARSTPAPHRRPRQTRRTPTQGSSPRRSRARRKAAHGNVLTLRSRATLQGRLNESIQAVYFAAGGHHIADGGHFVGGLCRIPATARFRPATSRLPHHPGTNVLSGSQPGRDGVFSDRAAGAPVWAGARAEPNDLDELLRQLDHYSPVRSRSQH